MPQLLEVQNPGEATQVPAGPVEVRRVVQGLGFMAFWIILLFLSAGTIHWVRGWICSIVYPFAMLLIAAYVHRRNPGLFPARAKWRHSDTKRFDKVILAIYLPLTVAQPVIAGLDVLRFRWSSMPVWTLYSGFCVFSLGVVVIGWALTENPWAESSVRIQTERGQRVVSTRPYRLVRHPIYVGMFLMNPGIACMLGSMALLILAGAIALILIVRTALEDRTLQRELPGYAEYAVVTRWRLLPGIW